MLSIMKAAGVPYNTDTIYNDLLEYVLKNGEHRVNRTGIHTSAVFGYQNRYDLRKEFPLLTTKKVYWKGVLHELLWFLKGDTNVKYLQDNDVHIWDEWAGPDGDLGPIYGHQWRNFGGVDQIASVIHQIKNNPDSRRHIVTAWNPQDVDAMALPPCHCLFQFNVTEEFIDCQLYQRSADAFLGVPFNIASYALLTHIVGHIVGKTPRYFIHSFGDLHIYDNHEEQVEEQLSRQPKTKRPWIEIDKRLNNIEFIKPEWIKLRDYEPHPAIKAEVAI